MIDFPYAVDDEPTEDWKVEQVLHWWLLRANSESEAEYDRIAEGLSKQLGEGKKVLWEAYEQVSEIIQDVEMTDNNNNNNNNSSNENVENQNQQQPSSSNSSNKRQQLTDKPDVKPTVAPAATAARPTRYRKAITATNTITTTTTTTTVADAANNLKPDTIHIDVFGGPYDGSFYDLQPKSRSHAWVGRSSSGKFKDRGISLPLDLEVSTSHGRFEYRAGGKFYYTDVASTNGSRINGEDCEPNRPYELSSTGIMILVGQTAMKVTLLTLA